MVTSMMIMWVRNLDKFPDRFLQTLTGKYIKKSCDTSLLLNYMYKLKVKPLLKKALI